MQGKQTFGYTLIELVFVMLLVSVLSAVVLPRLNLDTDLRDVFYMDDLASTLRFAQKQAVSLQCALAVGLNGNPPAFSFALQTPCTQGSLFSPIVGEDFVGAGSVQYGSNWSSRVQPHIVIGGAILLDVPFYFDSLGRARSMDSPYDIVNPTIAIRRQKMHIVGETGYIYVTSEATTLGDPKGKGS